MNIQEFQNRGPLFLPEEFLVGRLEGWAIVESALGNLRKRATILARGSNDSFLHHGSHVLHRFSSDGFNHFRHDRFDLWL